MTDPKTLPIVDDDETDAPLDDDQPLTDDVEDGADDPEGPGDGAS